MARRTRAAAGESPPWDGLCWLPAGGGYSVALEGAELRFRNPHGKLLEAVPGPVRASAAAEQLGSLVDLLGRHAAHVRVEAERLMLMERTLAGTEIGSLWRDPAWRDALGGLAIEISAPGDPSWTARSRHLLLTAASPDGLVEGLDLDAEPVRFQVETVAIPHPVRLDPDLRAALCAVAASAGVARGLEQLERDRPSLPTGLDPAATRVEGLVRGGRLTWPRIEARCAELGVRLRSGFATLALREQGRAIEIRLWLGARQGERGTEAAPAPGELCWIDGDGRSLPLGEVSPVAAAEGLRLASEIGATSTAPRTRRRT